MLYPGWRRSFGTSHGWVLRCGPSEDSYIASVMDQVEVQALPELENWARLPLPRAICPTLLLYRKPNMTRNQGHFQGKLCRWHREEQTNLHISSLWLNPGLGRFVAQHLKCGLVSLHSLTSQLKLVSLLLHHIRSRWVNTTRNRNGLGIFSLLNIGSFQNCSSKMLTENTAGV